MDKKGNQEIFVFFLPSRILKVTSSESAIILADETALNEVDSTKDISPNKGGESLPRS